MFAFKKWEMEVFNSFGELEQLLSDLHWLWYIYRGSIENLVKHLWRNVLRFTWTRVSFLIKLQVSACNFIKKEIWHRWNRKKLLLRCLTWFWYASASFFVHIFSLFFFFLWVKKQRFGGVRNSCNITNYQNKASWI